MPFSRPLFIILVLLILLASCSDIENRKIIDNHKTNEMIDSINSIIAKTDFRNHIYEYGKKLEVLTTEIEKAKTENRVTEAAIKVLEEILSHLPENNIINQRTKTFHETIALAYLRLGEQNNCINNHNHESCLFPISGEGTHQDEYGSREAIKKTINWQLPL